MKLAYIAADRSALKSIDVIKNFYSEVHFYFSDEQLPLIDLELEKLPILTENVCIPAREELRTFKHKSVLKRLKTKQSEFYNEIYAAKSSPEPVPLGTSEIKVEEFKFSEINFVKFGRELGKYMIENNRQEIIEYDFLLLQNNHYIMNAILDKQQNLFNLFTEQSRCLLTLEFKIKGKHGAPQMEQDFLFIENSLLKSVDDNWYVFSLNNERLSVSLYIPIEMQSDVEYINFLVNRITAVVQQSFVSFHVVEFERSFRHPVDGYFTYRAKLRQSKAGSLIPTYTFWTNERMNSHLHQVLKVHQNQQVKEKKVRG